MSGKKIQSIQGTFDLLPGEWTWWRTLEDAARMEFELAGYSEIRTPIIESAQLFIKGTGATTDIVQKEMYIIPQEKGDGIALRPEGTPSVIRAYLEHGLAQKKKFQKLYYIGPMFRRERPQKGRQRQFHQIGIEAIGASSPLLDAETIITAVNVYRRMGLSGFETHLNSIGCEKCRPEFRKAVIGKLKAHKDQLCDLCRERLERNVFRIIDCKEPGCRALCAGLPRMVDFLCDDCAPHYARVKEALNEAGVPFEEDPYLVRGLDYYTKTVFEIAHGSLGARSAICGGGRYDALVEGLGGNPTPCVGFAMGTEASILAMQAELNENGLNGERSLDAYIVTFCPEARATAFAVLRRLRAACICADMDYEERSGKAQMRTANKLGARYVLIIGESELESKTVSMKVMATGEQISVPGAEIAGRITQELK